ncbi:hypothetical protein MMC34_001657 [Xylographa carneopallida]|nr:hypothetical protein [Xylographa carneopallida]
MTIEEDAEGLACHALTTFLLEKNYAFVCISPESQERVVRKRSLHPKTRNSANLEDFFGWSLPAEEKVIRDILPVKILDLLREASVVTAGDDGLYRSKFRVSSFYMPDIEDSLSLTRLYYIHSAFPTTQRDSVFFGPDTYLFLDYLSSVTNRVPTRTPRTIVDICCGAGAGAILLARKFPASRVLALDLNPKALSVGIMNARFANTQVLFVESDLVSAMKSQDDIDLIVSNPPYISSSALDVPTHAIDGPISGLALPLRVVEESVPLLADRGLLIVYTAVPIPHQNPAYDPFLEHLSKVAGATLVSYKILHPDMFGEELSSPAYADVGRIQAVGAVLRKREGRMVPAVAGV